MSLGRFAKAPPGRLTGTKERGAFWRSQKHESGQDSRPSPAAHKSRGLFRGTLDDLVTTLFPADCRICTAPLVHISSLPVCETCLAALRPQAETQPGTLCHLCGEALGFESERFLEGRAAAAEEQICPPCRRLPPPFARAVAFGVYRGELRELIGLLKFEGMRAAAEPLGGALAQAIATVGPELDPARATLVTAVPLFRAKARQRGFNQAEVLAATALRQLRRTHPHLQLRPAHGLLARVKATESQFGLNPRQRRDNLRGAFAAPEPELVAGRDILLVDDIYTTGATARACAAALRQAGAQKIFVATVSRAQTETVALWGSDDAMFTIADRGPDKSSSASDRRS